MLTYIYTNILYVIIDSKYINNIIMWVKHTTSIFTFLLLCDAHFLQNVRNRAVETESLRPSARTKHTTSSAVTDTRV